MSPVRMTFLTETDKVLDEHLHVSRMYVFFSIAVCNSRYGL
jgi:hypothetical protein